MPRGESVVAGSMNGDGFDAVRSDLRKSLIAGLPGAAGRLSGRCARQARPCGGSGSERQRSGRGRAFRLDDALERRVRPARRAEPRLLEPRGQLLGRRKQRVAVLHRPSRQLVRGRERVPPHRREGRVLLGPLAAGRRPRLSGPVRVQELHLRPAAHQEQGRLDVRPHRGPRPGPRRTGHVAGDLDVAHRLGLRRLAVERRDRHHGSGEPAPRLLLRMGHLSSTGPCTTGCRGPSGRTTDGPSTWS